jgi:threonine aldolase
MKALKDANISHEVSYGADDFTQQCKEKFYNLFGKDIEIYFTFNGTAANTIAIASCTNSYNAVICADTAHIHVDECGSIEKFAGCKVLTLPTFDGKITTELIKNHMHGFGDQHHCQPKLISITQCTELGTVYTPKELKDICDYAHSFGMYVHMDGARIANATAYLDLDIKAFTKDVGIDVLSFGGTKNGMMFGEAIVYFNRELAKDTMYIRKQGMQLYSKMRFISTQFEAILTDELWLRTAKHANAMATLLAKEVGNIPQIKITQKVQANEVFAIIPREAIEKLQEKVFFYTWDEAAAEVRWVCSFDTTENDVMSFVELLKEDLL